jgi:hypothetical protein
MLADEDLHELISGFQGKPSRPFDTGFSVPHKVDLLE